MPGGGTARREIVEHYGAVAIVAIDDDGNIVAGLPVPAPGGPAAVGTARRAARHRRRAAAPDRGPRTRGGGGLAGRDWRVLVDVVSAPGFSDESVRVYLATGLTDVGRPDAHDEEADLMRASGSRWPTPCEMVFSGEIVNSLAVAGILAAHAVRPGRRRAAPGGRAVGRQADRGSRAASSRANERS